MGFIVRIEPIGSKYLEGYPQCKEMLQQIGWLQFLEKFNGCHKEVTKTFARSFQGTEVEIGDVKFTVNEVFIAEATGLYRAGERWFKNREFHNNSWKQILKSPNMDVSVFKKGIPSTALKSKWRNILLLLQKFVTCEGRYGTFYVYHMRLMLHFLGEDLNLPYFLYQSLKKMASCVQRRVQFLETTVYHHGLVKILIEHHLSKSNDTWDDFLIRNHFEEAKELSPEPQATKRSRRWRTPKGKIDKPVQESSEEVILEKLTRIKSQLKAEKVIKDSVIEKGEGSSQLRRSHRLKGKLKKTSIKQTGVINIEDEETSMEEYDDEDFYEGTPEIDPAQQEIYDYVETLERTASEREERTPSPPLTEIDILRRDRYELELLNRHIKNENEILKDQIKLKTDMNSTLSLHINKVERTNEKMKTRNKKLIRALTNLRFKLVIRKPRRPLAFRQRRRRGLDVLAEASEFIG